MQQTTPPPRSIRFSGRSFMAFVLAPEPPVSDWLADFDAFAARSPGFFAGRPVVVDISQLPAARPDLVHIVTELKRRNIAIMGLDGRKPGELGADARGLPPILTGSKDIPAALADEAQDGDQEAAPAQPDVTSAAHAAVAAALEEEAAGEGAEAPATEGNADAAPAAQPPAAEPPAAEPQNLIIDGAVRSGQSIVHLGGDVTVIGNVASGSEIVAAGSIHVYGALRGRAIAGSKGERTARIFANALHAELVAIDGLYKTAEDLERAMKGRPVHAYLDGEALKLSALT